LRSIASLANGEDGARCHARWPRALRAARRRSLWLARVLLFGIDSNRVQSSAGRGGTGVDFNPSGSAWSHAPYTALFAGAVSALASRNASPLNLPSTAVPARRPFRFYETAPGVRCYALLSLPLSRSARRYKVLRSIPRIFAA